MVQQQFLAEKREEQKKKTNFVDYWCTLNNTHSEYLLHLHVCGAAGAALFFSFLNSALRSCFYFHRFVCLCFIYFK